MPAQHRLDVSTVGDDQILNAVARLVADYMRSLAHLRDAGGGFVGSPFDRFLILNGLPRQPQAGESGWAFARRLRAALDAVAAPKWLDNPGVLEFEHHDQRFSFGAEELAAPDLSRRARGADGVRGRDLDRRSRRLRRLPRAPGVHGFRLPQQRRHAGVVRQTSRARAPSRRSRFQVSRNARPIQAPACRHPRSTHPAQERLLARPPRVSAVTSTSISGTCSPTMPDPPGEPRRGGSPGGGGGAGRDDGRSPAPDDSGLQDPDAA